MCCSTDDLYCRVLLCLFFLFFFNDAATTEIYTLSLHDALPILPRGGAVPALGHPDQHVHAGPGPHERVDQDARSEEHTSELQSLTNLVCRLLLEKKKKNTRRRTRKT